MEMIENDEYCVDIASQVNASMWLLKGVNTTLLENHLACCWPKFLNATEEWKKDARFHKVWWHELQEVEDSYSDYTIVRNPVKDTMRKSKRA